MDRGGARRLGGYITGVICTYISDLSGSRLQVKADTGHRGPYVRLGSKCDMPESPPRVRLTTESGQRLRVHVLANEVRSLLC
jgi:hypothetical protein